MAVSEVGSLLSWKGRELFFTLVIIVLVFAISLVQLRVSEMKTRDSQRKADVELVARALEAYFEDYKVYPMATDDGEIVSCGGKGLDRCVWGEGEIVDEENVTYLKKLPIDPRSGDGYKYVYQVDETRQNFKIYVGLEYRRDSSWKENLTMECGIKVQCSWYVESR